MQNSSDRFRSERAFFDSFYDKELREENLMLSDNDRPVQWVEYSMERFGDLKHKRVLDIGCGTGISSVLLAKKGAEVSAIDISESAVMIAKRRAKINNINIMIFQMAVENMAFKNNYFDAVFGNAILHHLDIETAIKEIYRVMKIYGKAMFNETSYLNPLFKILREFLPGHFGIPKKRTPHERPISYNDIDILKKIFREVEILRSYKFLSQAEEYLFSPDNLIAKYLNKIDNIILRHGFAKKFGYRIIIECIK